MLIVMTTVPERTAAEVLAESIVAKGLAACVQILPEMTSVYVWEGEIQKEGEHLLLIKTLPEKWDDLHEFVTANHTYAVPEIVAIDAERVSESYLQWLNEALESEKVKE